MGEIRHRQAETSPEIEYAEIHIPDDQNLGCGTYRTVLKPNALSKKEGIHSIMLNAPAFQISVNINVRTREIPVLVGKADGSDPRSRKTFILPAEIDKSRAQTFVGTFENWQITGLALNEMPLVEK